MLLTQLDEDNVAVDTQIAIALEARRRGDEMHAGHEVGVETVGDRGVVATRTVIDELHARDVERPTIRTVEPRPGGEAELRAIRAELDRNKVGGPGAQMDRQIIAEVMTSQTASGATATIVVQDGRVVNGLARMAGIRPDRLDGFRNVAEYLRHTRNTDRFEVAIAGRRLHVVPAQPVRKGPLRRTRRL
ncbi:MAG: hypothetical protein QNJ12_22200 [Ilumatobacter sp.]|uniref:hypothetical protein n=1 Tax=Ilumatobacter sp. TaxID=1967498 RepID=UPI0026324DF4|nr:hypothetical protein [Ilumatobacter sp.]MDJ0771514.1 hypothetical protein [Ilumatobacter sp.]